jgi:hypothetical protein
VNFSDWQTTRLAVIALYFQRAELGATYPQRPLRAAPGGPAGDGGAVGTLGTTTWGGVPPVARRQLDHTRPPASLGRRRCRSRRDGCDAGQPSGDRRAGGTPCAARDLRESRAELDRVGAGGEYDWNSRGRIFGRKTRLHSASCSNHRHLPANKIGRQRRQLLVSSLRPTPFDADTAMLQGSVSIALLEGDDLDPIRALAGRIASDRLEPTALGIDRV